MPAQRSGVARSVVGVVLLVLLPPYSCAQVDGPEPAPEPPPPPPKTCNTVGSCNGHGTCTPTTNGGRCACKGQWGGSTCTTAPCQNGHDDCGTHGTCVNNGDSHTCTCSTGYSGSTCGHSTGCDNNPCKNGGTCSADGAQHTCSCVGQWGGAECAESPCTNHNDCGDHGTCQDDGDSHTCECKREWGGLTCTTPPCQNGHNDCNSAGHGTCSTSGEVHECTCDPGWKNTKKPCDDCKHWCPANKPGTEQHTACGKKCQGETCGADCRAGFYGAHASYTCNSEGAWTSSAALSCTAQKCEGVPTGDGSHAEASSATFDDEKTRNPLVCQAGYTVDLSTVDPDKLGYTCAAVADPSNEVGQWSGTEKCVKKICPTEVNPTGDPQVKTTCSGDFQTDCDTYCYEGYEPQKKKKKRTLVTYTCGDKVDSVQGQWIQGTKGVPAEEPVARTCTGIPCKSAPPEAGGHAVANATACEAVDHYVRPTGNTPAVACNHGAGKDEPCDLGYDYNDYVQGSINWDECECCIYTSLPVNCKPHHLRTVQPTNYRCCQTRAILRANGHSLVETIDRLFAARSPAKGTRTVTRTARARCLRQAQHAPMPRA